MKKASALLAVVLALGLTVAMDADARRMGGGKSAGMQRQQVTTPAATPGAPANTGGAPSQAAPAAGAAAAAAAAPAAAAKRSWMGPLAGLAAGLGLAALASHFGFGEALAQFMTFALLALGVLLVVGFIARKRAQARMPALAPAGRGLGGMDASPMERSSTERNEPWSRSAGGTTIGSGLGAGAQQAPAAVPAGFDVAGFERQAGTQFMALQAANDARDLERLREFLTPEMLEIVRADLADRGDAPQHTEVFGLQPQLLAVTEEADRYVASVRFTGSTRDQHGAPPDDLDETWHLVKPRAGNAGWVIAGIQQGTPAAP